MNKKNIFLFFLVLFGFINLVQAQESLTITTFYPSPYGVFNEFRSKRMAIGDNYYDNSHYCWSGACGTTIDANADLVVEGNVGIGTTNPQSPLDVKDRIQLDSTGGDAWIKFLTAGALKASVFGTDDGTGGTSLRFFTQNNASFGERMRILKTGYIGIGTINPNYQLELSMDSAGKPTSNTWTVVSDKRLKKDIEAFTDGLNVLLKIHPVKYKLNGKAGTPNNQEGISIIAQEIKDIAPYTIKSYKAKLEPTDKEETELLNFDSSPLTFILINAVKEQQKQIDILKSELNTLKSQLKTKQ